MSSSPCMCAKVAILRSRDHMEALQTRYVGGLEPCTHALTCTMTRLPWYLWPVLLVGMLPQYCNAFSPKSKIELSGAVNACLELSPGGDCSNGPHGPIGNWHVSRVTDMSTMFSHKFKFNGDISKWNVAKVIDMDFMFNEAQKFNSDISKWDVSSVKSMSRMFMSAKSFNGDLSKWDVSSVTSMPSMFLSANSFNGDLSKWDVTSVTDMNYMFYEARSFNVDLSKWNVSSVTAMNGMFYNARLFKQELCGHAWIYSKVSNDAMFEGTWGGSICTPTTTPATTQVTATTQENSRYRRPFPGGRELIFRAPITTPLSTSAFTSTILSTMMCPKCGMFRKSGRVSCCAPGGTWFKNCGGAANKNVDYRWSEGAEACKPRTTRTTISSTCPECGTIGKSGKTSCCALGGSWFKNCGGAGNARLQHTWYEGIHACKARRQSRTAVGQQENAAQQKGIDSSHSDSKVNSTGVITVAKPCTFSSGNMPMSMAGTASMIMASSGPAGTSTAYATPTTNSKVICGASITTISMSDNMATSSITADIASAPSPSITSVSTSVTTQGREMLVNIVIHINLLIMIIFQS